MTKRPVLLVAAAASALLMTGASPAWALPEPEPMTVGVVEGGRLSIDSSTIRTRGGWRRGWRQVQATIELAQPFSYAAREVTSETQTQDWDCAGSRYRVILRVFRTSDRKFVLSQRGNGPWSDVPDEGPERRLFEKLCPAAAE